LLTAAFLPAGCGTSRQQVVVKSTPVPAPAPAPKVEPNAADQPKIEPKGVDEPGSDIVVQGKKDKQTQPAAAGQTEPVGPVDEKDLLNAASNTANWLMYGRTYDAQRYSPLAQINKKNVHKLTPAWTFQTGVLDGFECSPLVIDGIMYITTPWNHAYAIDCKTGSQLWHYQKSLPENLALCCDAVNRGFAAWGERLYMTTLDAHLVCLDRNTGEEIWDTEITVTEDGKEVKQIYKMAYSATVAPLVVKDKVIMGISGAEYGIRGFIDAYDAKTGKRAWRFYTVPSPDDKAEHYQKALKTWEGKSWLTGGGSAWVTGTYDPKLNTLYWGIGNPSPDFNGEVRKGDNLYTVSIVALDPDDGTYKWHFQASPHDVWDYDGVNEPVLVDIDQGGGKTLKGIVQAHRNGYFYCLNRENGAFVYGKPFCEVTWTDLKKGVDGLDPKTGRPFINPAALPTEKGVRVCPGAAGGKEWNPMAYSPQTGLAYVPVINNCAKFTSGKAFFIKGQPYWGSSLTLIDNQASGSFKAIDVKTGKSKWEVATRSPMVAGVLATGGGLVFTGDAEGFFTAYDADTGKVLWNFQCGSGHHASPVTYTLEGRQYIAIAVGWGGWTAGFAGDGAPWLRNARRGNTVFVFALPRE
jgi:alcohol dehydrogenase (cytochrome c)